MPDEPAKTEPQKGDAPGVIRDVSQLVTPTKVVDPGAGVLVEPKTAPEGMVPKALYDESGKEAKRLFGVTKEQEKTIKDLQGEQKDVAEKLKRLEYYEPFAHTLETDPNFLRYVSQYDPQKGTPNRMSSSELGLGDNFEDFDPAEMHDPRTPSGKYFEDRIMALAEKVVSTKLGAYAEKRGTEDAEKQRKLATEQQITEFVAKNEDYTREDVESALKTVKEKKVSVADIVYLANRDEILKKTAESARADVSAAFVKDPNMLATLASKSSDADTPDVNDRILAGFEQQLDTMGLGVT